MDEMDVWSGGVEWQTEWTCRVDGWSGLVKWTRGMDV